MDPTLPEQLFTSGRIVDIVLVVMAFEAGVVLLLLRKRQGLGAVDILGNLLAGAMLVLAVRCALVGAPWFLTATFLAASFPAHVFDLWRRYQHNREGDDTWTTRMKRVD
ncbi:MAG: hypothetical protein RIT81_26370 [Deltaproteobacteria bacterium]